MLGGYRALKVGICTDIALDDQGEPMCDVMSEDNVFYRNVKILVQGGSADNCEYRPVKTSDIPDSLLMDFEGAFVLMGWLKIHGDPVIIGSLVSRNVRGLFNATKEAREEDASETDSDGRVLTKNIDFRSYYNRLDGAVISIGHKGITLDTHDAEEAIRVQVPADKHLRVSQAGFSTNDHVVLASHLLQKLSELETAINTLGEKVAAIEAITATLSAQPNGGPVVNTGPNPIVPQPLFGPAVTWVKGDDDDYRADCMRISAKATGD